MPETSENLTQLLIDASKGDKNSLDEILPFVYDELRKIAQNYLNRERTDHTLQATALVHEAYLRLIDQRKVDWQNRSQFFGLASNMMRRILVNHAESYKAEKRGSGQKLQLDETVDVSFEENLDLIDLDEALKKMAEIDEQKSKIVEMRFFGGLTIDETAQVLGKSHATIEREWAFAKAWLYRELK
ncbi:MAG TPA: sigma-70 family RNA polymerase sigma factor [Pyrinomonadaceae bacterium]|nr:sigma-70 family RNA polymerase sigma factor [Pyrinomonadaceae bacterium]